MEEEEEEEREEEEEVEEAEGEEEEEEEAPRPFFSLPPPPQALLASLALVWSRMSSVAVRYLRSSVQGRLTGRFCSGQTPLDLLLHGFSDCRGGERARKREREREKNREGL